MKPFPITAVMQSIAAKLPKASVTLVTTTPDMLESACTSIIRRKQSAELPFDLDRAKGGDVVQVLRSDGVWFDALDTDNTLPIKLFELGKEKELRMKYPPKKKISSILNQE